MRSNTKAAGRGLTLSIALLVIVTAAIIGQRQAAAQPAGDPAEKAAPTEAAPAEAPADETPVGDEASATGDATTAGPAPTGETPVNIRLRQLEQRVQALKERAWRAKARVEMLKEAVLGGGIGARATIEHVNKMGSSYRLIQLVYALDGTTIFTRKDDTGKLHETKRFDILAGPITPGSHTLTVMAVYRGHGYGVFKYLKKYKFTARSSHTFTVDEGKGITIKVVGFERGGTTTPLEDRPALDFQVSVAKE